MVIDIRHLLENQDQVRPHSLLVSFLTGKKDKKVFCNVFDHVLLVIPTSSRNSMKKNIFKKHQEDKKV
jgi:hypothetical protein